MKKLFFFPFLCLLLASCVALPHATIKVSSFHVDSETGSRVEYNPAFVCFLPGDLLIPDRVLSKAFSLSKFPEVEYKGKKYVMSENTFFVIKENDLKEHDSNVSDILVTGQYDEGTEEAFWTRRNSGEDGDIQKIWKLKRDELTSFDKLTRGFSWIIFPLYTPVE